ncbi:MAG: adenosylmethionine decarboxylase [Ardenticatenales bacterium]|nr:adenosylmethionine decarboxylase [Ardenticatenales bacterium]
MSRLHLLYDVWMEDRELLKWVAPWPALLRHAAQQSGATVLAEQFHQFEPHGVTGVLLLSESHISVHTWPEEGLAVLDLFTCGSADMARVVGWLREQLCPYQESLTTVERGRTT